MQNNGSQSAIVIHGQSTNSLYRWVNSRIGRQFARPNSRVNLVCYTNNIAPWLAWNTTHQWQQFLTTGASASIKSPRFYQSRNLASHKQLWVFKTQLDDLISMINICSLIQSHLVNTLNHNRSCLLGSPGIARLSSCLNFGKTFHSRDC